MKTLRLILIMLLAVVSVSAYGRRMPGERVGVKIDEIAYDFGTVKESSDAIVHEYMVSNVGPGALAIMWVKPKCGCTVPEYPRKPLMSGESAKIKVTFDPRGQRGEVDKDIRVKFRNAAGKSEEISLRIRGVVVP